MDALLLLDLLSLPAPDVVFPGTCLQLDYFTASSIGSAKQSSNVYPIQVALRSKKRMIDPP